MRASHVALLSLAASTAAPVFAAPLSYFNARSKDAGAALSTRSPGDCTKGTSKNHEPQSHNHAGSENHTPESQAHSGNPEGLFDRDFMDDYITAIANMKSRRSGVGQGTDARGWSDNAFGVGERDVSPNTPESLAAGVTPEDFAAAMLNDRSLSSGQDLQARALFSLGMGVLDQLFRRDVDTELLAARDGVEDFVNSIISRDSNPEQMQARDGFAQILNALASSRRDVQPDGLAARGDLEDFVGMLNSRRDTATANDILDAYFSGLATREPSPEQETQARDIPDSPKIVARDGSATDKFIKALYNTRDSSKRELTAEDVLSLASLASRALDDLD